MKNYFLFITLSNIGDAIMTTPVIEWIHRENPEYLVDIVCDKKSYPIFRYCPYINHIYIKDKKKGFIGNLKLIKLLRQKKYEIAIDLRTDVFLFFVKAQKKYFKIIDNYSHSVIKHFKSLRISTQNIPNPKIWIPDKIQKNINEKFLLKNKKILVLGIGANSKHKIWDYENYVYLVKKLEKKFDLIILLGDKHDNKIALEFMEKYDKNVLNLCGKLSLIESSAVIKKSLYFIGNDSGLGHIAAALDVPSFTIFGREDLKRYHPWGRHSAWYQNKDKNINLIDPETVYKKIIKKI